MMTVVVGVISSTAAAAVSADNHYFFARISKKTIPKNLESIAIHRTLALSKFASKSINAFHTRTKQLTNQI